MLKNIWNEYTQSHMKFIDAIPEVVIVLKYLAHSVYCNTKYLQQCTVSFCDHMNKGSVCCVETNIKT